MNHNRKHVISSAQRHFMSLLSTLSLTLCLSTSALAGDQKVYTTIGVISQKVEVPTTSVSQNYSELGVISVNQAKQEFYSANVYGKNGYISTDFKAYYSLYHKGYFRFGIGVGFYTDIATSGGLGIGDKGFDATAKIVFQDPTPWVGYIDFTQRLTGSPANVTVTNISGGLGYAF